MQPISSMSLTDPSNMNQQISQIGKTRPFGEEKKPEIMPQKPEPDRQSTLLANIDYSDSDNARIIEQSLNETESLNPELETCPVISQKNMETLNATKYVPYNHLGSGELGKMNKSFFTTIKESLNYDNLVKFITLIIIITCFRFETVSNFFQSIIEKITTNSVIVSLFQSMLMALMYFVVILFLEKYRK